VSGSNRIFLSVPSGGGAPGRDFACALILLWLWLSPATAAWETVARGRFGIVTDCGYATAAQVLAVLEEAEGCARLIFARQPDERIQLRVVILSRDQDYVPFQTSLTTAGTYVRGAEADYIVLSRTAAGNSRHIRHEYIHFLMSRAYGKLPDWLEEGAAEYYSTAQVSKSRLTTGGSIDSHLALLRERTWIPARELAVLDPVRTPFRDGGQLGLYYAQSWALVHLLAHTTAGLQSFLEKPDMPFEEAFGMSLDEAQNKLHAYLGQAWLPSRSTEVAGRPVLSRERPAARVLSVEESAVRLAEVYLAADRPEAAAKLAQQASLRNPDGSAAATLRGLVALAAGDRAEALRWFDQAIAKGSSLTLPYFESATLLREMAAGSEVVRQRLRRVVELSPAHADAWYLLADVALSQGDRAGQIRCLEQATALMPRRSFFWDALSRAALAAGDREKALTAAKQALAAAHTEQEAGMARGTLRELTEVQKPTTPRVPKTVVPDGWKAPAGDLRVEGTLVSVDCSGSRLRFELRVVGQGSLSLFTEHPDRVALRNARDATREFPCGKQSPAREVSVEYLKSGEIVAIEFR